MAIGMDRNYFENAFQYSNETSNMTIFIYVQYSFIMCTQVMCVLYRIIISIWFNKLLVVGVRSYVSLLFYKTWPFSLSLSLLIRINITNKWISPQTFPQYTHIKKALHLILFIKRRIKSFYVEKRHLVTLFWIQKISIAHTIKTLFHTYQFGLFTTNKIEIQISCVRSCWETAQKKTL